MGMIVVNPFDATFNGCGLFSAIVGRGIYILETRYRLHDLFMSNILIINLISLFEPIVKCVILNFIIFFVKFYLILIIKEIILIDM